MALLDLPQVILYIICAYISARDKVVWLSASRKCSQSLEPIYYRQDAYGKKPAALIWASKNGKVQTIKKAVAATDGVRISQGVDGRSPLSLAAKAGHESAVELLLGGERADPNERDAHGQAPLSLSSFMGHIGVVKLLLPVNGINPDPSYNYGRSALSLAEAGQAGVVELLLGMEGLMPTLGTLTASHRFGRVDVGMTDNDGNTPLAWAAWKGNLDMVELLLATKEVNPSSKNNKGQTALTTASIKGNEAVVKLLLATEDVDPDSKDNSGSTPLFFAASGGHEAVVRLLLQTGRVDSSHINDSGNTAIEEAQWNYHLGIIELLNHWEDVHRI
ncbi:hypothetical protein VE03_04751 [Pseudogymnoascus sp. 23342-1-I1]|nr:hypothetical protein VE03_04751 [Pseudogymnoascus sp. 23342-1-I1]